MERVRAHVVIYGLVQGVYFRAHTQETAKRHNVFGWVKNNPNGTVEAVLEGRRDDVERVVEWCRIGPQSARVDNVDVDWGAFKGEFDDFLVLTRHTTY
jgi:acylphosphatase